jgi:peptidoglycan hydrolase-like protein with peptidoglycan-binding domain
VGTIGVVPVESPVCRRRLLKGRDSVARVKATVAVVGAVLSLALVGCSAGTDRTATEEQSSPTPTATSPAPTRTASLMPSPTPTPTPTRTALYLTGDESDGVRDLQARLKQLEWYEPKITGLFDDVTLVAVTGFQEKRGFPATGEVDQQTWDKLVSMTHQPTDDEMHNRLVPGPTIIGVRDSGDRVRELQARLKQIGWFNADVTGNYGSTTTASVAGFQTKRAIPSTGEVDQRTWDRLVAMTRTPTNDELHNRVPSNGSSAGLDPRCTTGRALCIDKSTRSLRWAVNGSVLMTLDVRFGSELTPTREGAFSVNFKSRDHYSELYDSPMPFAMFFSGGQAVHYSPDFAANGYNGSSHGCVNVRNRAAIESLFDQVRIGDKVIVYWS